MNIKEFKASLPAYRALIGFDYGAKRLGVAVSDLLLTVATSYKIIQRIITFFYINTFIGNIIYN